MNKNELTERAKRYFGPRLHCWRKEDLVVFNLNQDSRDVLSSIGMPNVADVNDSSMMNSLERIETTGQHRDLLIFGRGDISSNCIKEGEVNPIFVTVDGESVARFANSGPLEWVAFLEMYDRAISSTARPFGTAELALVMKDLDPAAFDDEEENVWPLVLEQMRDVWGMDEAK